MSEWFTSHERYDSVYACTIELLTSEDDVLSHLIHSKVMKGEEKNQWFKVSVFMTDFQSQIINYSKYLFDTFIV